MSNDQDDPWEEVSDQCEFDVWGLVQYKGDELPGEARGNHGAQFKYGPGLRVWKRKEGT